eukprot:scaffold678718_cov92-Prasinocladus_malaysianus.AAC.1
MESSNRHDAFLGNELSGVPEVPDAEGYMQDDAADGDNDGSQEGNGDHSDPADYYSNEEEEDDDDYDDAGIFGSDGAMDPNHPLLARAQVALKEQLLEAEIKLQDDLREKSKGVK